VSFSDELQHEAEAFSKPQGKPLINQVDLLKQKHQNCLHRFRNRQETSMFFFKTPVALAALLAAGIACAADQPVIGLITKTETNPFFVKMKEGAQQAAQAKGAKLLSGAGKADGDNAGQVTAMENMIAGGAKTILITPSDSKAIIPAIQMARAKGVLEIALDSPTV